jgi:hypothetical protein
MTNLEIGGLAQLSFFAFPTTQRGCPSFAFVAKLGTTELAF